MKPSDVELRNQQRESAELPLFEQSFAKFESGLSSNPTAAQCEKGTVVNPVSDGCSTRPQGGQSNRAQSLQFAHARKTDPATSHKAAASVVNLGPVRDAILQLMGDYGPMSDETLIREYTRYSGMYPKATESGLRTRRSELVRMGFVEACGTGKTASGRPCTIWRLK